VVARADVRATRAATRQPANSQAMQCAMTATRDVATTVSSPTTVLSVVLRPEPVILQRHALAIQVLVLKMQARLMATAVVIVFNVPAVNAQVVISSAGVSWVATRGLETTLLLATVRRVRSAALVEDRTLCLEIMSASRCNRIS
jgi:hypothetical protein